jgi:hypothetical protein
MGTVHVPYRTNAFQRQMQRASEHKTKKNFSDLLDYELFRLLQELIGLGWTS